MKPQQRQTPDARQSIQTIINLDFYPPASLILTCVLGVSGLHILEVTVFVLFRLYVLHCVQ